MKITTREKRDDDYYVTPLEGGEYMCLDKNTDYMLALTWKPGGKETVTYTGSPFHIAVIKDIIRRMKKRIRNYQPRTPNN